jgi:hypothetical protein
LRLIIVIAILAVTVPVTFFLHTRTVTVPSIHRPSRTTVKQFHPEWQDPVAVLIALSATALAAGVALTARQSS